MLKRWMGQGRGMLRGKLKCQNLLFRSLPKSSLARVLQWAGDWRPKQQNQWSQNGYISFGGQTVIPDFMKFSAPTAQKGAVCRYLSPYFRGSKQISCPCLCPSSCSWGRCQLAPLKEGKGLHLVYIPASNPWMNGKWKIFSYSDPGLSIDVHYYNKKSRDNLLV